MDDLPETLICTKCKRELPLDAFAKKASNTHRYGLQNWCRACNKEYQDARYAVPEHRDAAIKRMADWVAANPERAKATQKALYDRKRADPEAWASILATQRGYYHANIEENRAKGAAYMRKWYASLSPARKWLYANRTHLKRKGVLTIPFTDDEFVAKWEYWDNRCWICGTDQRLETDHMKPVTMGGMSAICNFRPICRSCNPAKGNQWPFPLDPAEARAVIGVEYVGPTTNRRTKVVVKRQRQVGGMPLIDLV